MALSVRIGWGARFVKLFPALFGDFVGEFPEGGGGAGLGADEIQGVGGINAQGGGGGNSILVGG